MDVKKLGRIPTAAAGAPQARLTSMSRAVTRPHSATTTSMP